MHPHHDYYLWYPTLSQQESGELNRGKSFLETASHDSRDLSFQQKTFLPSKVIAPKSHGWVFSWWMSFGWVFEKKTHPKLIHPRKNSSKTHPSSKKLIHSVRLTFFSRTTARGNIFQDVGRAKNMQKNAFQSRSRILASERRALPPIYRELVCR